MLEIEFKDAIFDKHRNYKVSEHEDGTVSLEDKTEYLQEGTKINALLMQAIADEINRNTPVGAVFEFAGANAPDGYLLCHGQVVSRTEYDRLFSVIGTTYGSGDGSTTFNLPDFRGRFLMGNDGTLGGKGGLSTATLKVSNLPAHNHTAAVAINNAGEHAHSASSASAGTHGHSASSASAGAHAHSVSGTAANNGSHNHTVSVASAGAHTHTHDGPLGKGGTTAAAYDGATTNTYYRTGIISKTTTSAGAHAHSASSGSAGAHAHSVSGTAASAGGHAHTISVASAGAHTHTISVANNGIHNHSGSVSVGNTGSGEAFSIIPPFIKINYIIRY